MKDCLPWEVLYVDDLIAESKNDLRGRIVKLKIIFGTKCLKVNTAKMYGGKQKGKGLVTVCKKEVGNNLILHTTCQK